MKKFIDILSGIKLTAVSGLFLLASLILLLLKIKVQVDPAWITVLISGIPLLYSAVTRLIFQKWISSPLLISIAMVASISIGELFAAGEVAFIMAIGAILEDMTVERAKKSLKNLIALAPTEARKLVRENDTTKEIIIPAQDITIGDTLRVLPGEAIPVDGKILSGSTSINQSVITGESLPVDKCEGDLVFCGTLNTLGSIDIEAQKVGEDSSLQKLIKLVKEAEEKKAPMQRIVDVWAIWLVPIALLIAILTFIITWLIGIPVMTALNRAVTVLVVFCPCALALATPTSIAAAIGQATKHGVIIKSGEALEKMGKVDTITFDKTGTLTLGELSVENIISFETKYSGDDILQICASIEAKSEHPLAKAIIKYAKNKNIRIEETTDFVIEAGKGVYAKLNNDIVYCGNEKYLRAKNIQIEQEVSDKIKQYTNEGKAIILAGMDNKCIGLITLSDVIRYNSKQVIEELNNMGIETVLLTGDNEKTAAYIAQKLHVKTVFANLLPEDKVENIKKLQQENKNVCMIGDGVNDAPALKTANVGVSMGKEGSDIAVDASEVALMSDDISKIPYLKKLSNLTVKTIKFNISLSMAINFVAITMSVLGMLNPITGALVHNAGSVLVVLNAALLYDRKI